MKRFVILCWLAAGSVTALLLVQIKQEVRVLEDEIAGTQRQILHDQEAVHILEAEWSYLNSPARIAAPVVAQVMHLLTGRVGARFGLLARAARQRGADIRLRASLEPRGYFGDAAGSQRFRPLFRRFYPDRGNFLGLVSDFGSRRALRALAAAFRADSDFPLEHLATFRWIPGVALAEIRRARQDPEGGAAGQHVLELPEVGALQRKRLLRVPEVQKSVSQREDE